VTEPIDDPTNGPDDDAPADDLSPELIEELTQSEPEAFWPSDAFVSEPEAEHPEPPENVVSIKAGKRKASASAPASDPPPSPEIRDANEKGTGGVAPKSAKREKKIDWGRYTYMVENFVFIYPTDTAWDREKHKAVKLANMAHMFGADYVRMWKTSPDRRTIDEEQLVFDPTGQADDECINLWTGLAVEPVACKPEEVAVMLKLLRHLCGRCDSSISSVDEVMHWVLRWLALPFQKPGAKMATALIFHGPQGVGKNLFFDVIRDMYGDYGVMVGQTEIEEKYNGWISAKQMVICNEVVSRQELYHNKNRLKWMIDAERIPIRTMHTDTRWENNHANLVFLSNEKKPLVIEIGDRRHLVVYTPTPEEPELYEEVRAFLEAGGAAKFLHYLLTYPLEDFHEHTKPLMTEAKQELIELSMEPSERFMIEWLNGYLHLPVNVCSAEQLYRAFKRWAENTGERWFPNQASFTSACRKWAMERIEKDELGNRLEPCIDYRVIQVKAESARTSVRCFVPRGCEPLNGVTWGDWAARAVDAFDAALSRFLRTREGDDGSTPAPPPSAKKTKGGDE